MKDKIDKLNQNVSAIKKDINKLLTTKYGINGVKVNQINFASTVGSPGPDYKEVCKYFGKDPVTGKPIIKCKWVKVKQV